MLPDSCFMLQPTILEARVGEAGLVLVFAAAVFVGDVAGFVGFEEDDLADAFVDVDAEGEVGEVAEFDDEASRPAGFERRGVEHEAGAGFSKHLFFAQSSSSKSVKW